MIKDSALTKSAYTTGDIAKMLGHTVRTIQEWDRQGKLSFKRNPVNNFRFMTREDTIALLKAYDLYVDDRVNSKHDVLYARVSSHDQKAHGDLDRQVVFLMTHCPDLKNPMVLSEVGSGLNDNRKQLQKLLSMIMNDEVSRVFVTYKDRLTRFGYHYLETVFEAKGVPIIVVKEEQAAKSIEHEMVDDMMSLIASFSGKLYGMRSKRKGQNHGRKEAMDA